MDILVYQIIFLQTIFCFFSHFLPCSAPMEGLKWRKKDLEHPKLNFFSNLNNIPYHIELSFNHLLLTYWN